MSTCLLIIDPDQDWATQLSTYLLDNSILATTAINGKEAQLLIYKYQYQIIILDMLTKDHSWPEVLRYLKLFAQSMKIILTMPDKSMLKDLGVEIKDLISMGASDVLVKPLSPEAILKCISDGQKMDTWKEIENSDLPIENKDEEELKTRDEEFTSIKLEGFFSGSRTIYDHYIRIGKDRYLKILHKGDVFNQDRLKKYIESKLEFLYFKNEDRLTFINFSNELLKKLIGSKTETTEKKFKLVENLTEKYLEELYSSGISHDIIEEGKALCQNMINFISKEPEIYNVIKNFEQYNPSRHQHHFLVCFFSVLLCQKLDWITTRTLEIVAMGSLLHDIGELNLPVTIRGKSPSLLNMEELKIYHTHPKLGADMLEKFVTIPGSVKQIVYQHHEFSNGEGFPNGLTSIKIYPPAKIVTICNEYTNFLTEMKLSPLEGLKKFLKDRAKLSRFDPENIKALVRGFIKD